MKLSNLIPRPFSTPLASPPPLIKGGKEKG